MSKELNIDEFGKIIDKQIREDDVKLLIELPEGSMDPEIKSVYGIPVIDLYIMIHALKKVITDLFKQGELLDPDKKGDFLDGILDMIKGEILEEEADDGRDTSQK